LAQNWQKQMPKMCKYEGKPANTLPNFTPDSNRSAAPIDCSSGGALMLFILAAETFSKIFTTYSHALYSCPASGLEIRNRRKNRQEKN
jgi:hypothetical protein